MSEWSDCVSMMKNMPRMKRRSPNSRPDADGLNKVLVWMQKKADAVNLTAICKGAKVSLTTARRVMWHLSDNGEVEVHKPEGKRHFLYTLKED